MTAVAIYGGFPSDGGDWKDRDWEVNLTILSGDIGTENDSSENCYHVVTGGGTDTSAVLDGFTISVGMFNQYSSPSLSNITFSGNSATDFAGGMYNYESNPNLINAIFNGNSASSGGGMSNEYNSSPIMINATLEEWWVSDPPYRCVTIVLRHDPCSHRFIIPSLRYRIVGSGENNATKEWWGSDPPNG